MTKSELIESIARSQKHLPAKDVELAVKHILELMSEALANGKRIEIRGFGSFSLHYRPPQPQDGRSGGARGEERAALQARQGSARTRERVQAPARSRLIAGASGLAPLPNAH
jgi:integration host factor subunit beta